jgi:SulP family sulfate permease
VRIFKSTRSDATLMVTTFLLTVLVDLSLAIQVGVMLAALLFMKRMADVTHTKMWYGDTSDADADAPDEADDEDSIRRRQVPEGVAVFEINGPFFFGAADKFKGTLNTVQKKPRVLVLRMRHVLSLDATALRALEDVFDKAQRDGTAVVLSGVHAQPLVVMKQSGFADRVGMENMTSTIDQALERARALLAPK